MHNISIYVICVWCCISYIKYWYWLTFSTAPKILFPHFQDTFLLPFLSCSSPYTKVKSEVGMPDIFFSTHVIIKGRLRKRIKNSDKNNLCCVYSQEEFFTIEELQIQAHKPAYVWNGCFSSECQIHKVTKEQKWESPVQCPLVSNALKEIISLQILLLLFWKQSVQS